MTLRKKRQIAKRAVTKGAGRSALVALALAVAFQGAATPAVYAQEGSVRGAGTVGPAVGAEAARAALDAVVEEALRSNLGLEQERLLVARAEADVREARGGYMPSLSLTGRYSEQSGAVDLGEFVNPELHSCSTLSGRNSRSTPQPASR